MPVRTASLTYQIQRNGARLHIAIASRVQSHGVDHAPSEHEVALLDERHLLKEARAQRQAQAKLPKPKAVRLVKEAKPPKAPKAPKPPKAAKEPKEAKETKSNKPSRADKLTKKAENVEAAKKAAKKSAKV